LFSALKRVGLDEADVAIRELIGLQNDVGQTGEAATDDKEE